MNAVKQERQRFTLSTRSEKDIVKARPYKGEHVELVKKITGEQSKANSEIIKELATV